MKQLRNSNDQAEQLPGIYENWYPYIRFVPHWLSMLH